MDARLAARRLLVNGIVQGVGFRPFVYQLALRHGLKGEVGNTSEGVQIDIEGPPEKLAAFEAELVSRTPPLARITELRAADGEVRGLQTFRIAESRRGTSMETLIPPDVAVCADCLAELFDPHDRRFRYAFINCTNCGPRYTIIEDIPYDRPKTSMRDFPMCAACRAEYEDPADRRFHAQPNACPVCGPRLELRSAAGERVEAADPVAAAAALLREGAVLAVKGLGGFHLAVDAFDARAVARLRERKRREEKPLAVMSPDLAAVRAYAFVEEEEGRLLSSPERPIVLLRKRPESPLAAGVAPRNRDVGVLLPYTPLHHLLLAEGFSALVMTSGNLSEEPIASGNEEALARLSGIADAFLLHDRGIVRRCDDSVVRRVAGKTRFVRRARGYVPRPVFLSRRLPPLLAVGAELKNTVCLVKGDRAFLSPHIGDLENLATYEAFCETIAHLERVLEIRPEILACDLHPDYLSTRWAEERSGVALRRVQHHHAHVAACMAEHGLEGPVIGIACDGTGYGPDGTVWGGEVLAADTVGFERLAHLACVPMPGGTAAIREPWRMAVSHLQAAYGSGFSRLELPFLAEVGAEKIRAAAALGASGINSPLTSSLGRLFDAVAAIVGLRRRVAFEGQAAMELEMEAAEGVEDAYETEWEEGSPRRILPEPILRGVVADVLRGRPASEISARFHNGLVRLFVRLCRRIRAERGLSRVVLSGGVFQNARLLADLSCGLAAAGFAVYSHEQVPTNDGGIALGQALIAGSAA
ncbi:MAG: carbamoyltransferase HypF [Desulfobacterales bacterium]